MEANEIMAGLRRIAPSILVSVAKEHDPWFPGWDGDDPDPEEEGFYPHDVIVTAAAIVGGAMVEGKAYLGGYYCEPHEMVGDAHGYLPQMIEEALEELRPKVEDAYNLEVVRAIMFLKDEVRSRN